jgi:hypothetical protein
MEHWLVLFVSAPCVCASLESTSSISVTGDDFGPVCQIDQLDLTCLQVWAVSVLLAISLTVNVVAARTLVSDVPHEDITDGAVSQEGEDIVEGVRLPPCADSLVWQSSSRAYLNREYHPPRVRQVALFAILLRRYD